MHSSTYVYLTGAEKMYASVINGTLAVEIYDDAGGTLVLRLGLDQATDLTIAIDQAVQDYDLAGTMPGQDAAPPDALWPEGEPLTPGQIRREIKRGATEG